MSARTTRLAGLLALASTLAVGAGCIDLPTGVGRSGDAGSDAGRADGGDGFAPLSLSRVDPAAAPAEGGRRVTLRGTGFRDGAEVAFGGRPANGVLALEGGEELNVDVPAHDPGLVDIRVTLPDGTSETLEDAFLYRSGLDLDDVEPEQGPARGGTEITVSGEGFGVDTRVLVGGRLLRDPELVDGQTIRGRVPARSRHGEGRVDVVVSNGFEQHTLDRGYRYLQPPGPTAVTPAAGAAAGGTRVELRGRGLGPSTVVEVGGQYAEVVDEGGPRSITVRTPPGEPGLADLRIENELAARRLDDAFRYLDAPEAAPPALRHAWPSRLASGGGTEVSLAVTGLPDELSASEVSVRLQGAEAEVAAVRPEQHRVQIVAPEGEPGPVPVEVQAKDNVVSRSGLVRYVPELRIDRVEPATGSPNGGDEVTLAGNGFPESPRVRFGAAEAELVERVSSEELRVRTPPGVPGRVAVRVAGEDRTVRAPEAFGYRTGGEPTLLAVSPTSGSRAGGRLLRLHGTGFRSDQGWLEEIRLNDRPAEAIEVVDDGTVRLRAPRSRVGSVNVDAGSAGRLAMAFDYFDPTTGLGGTSGGPMREALNVTVIDAIQREPIPEAFVMLWDDLGTPYQGVTDDRGQIVFSDVGFGAPQMVTAAKDRHTTSSVVEFGARDVTLMLVPFNPSQPGGGGGGGGSEPLPDGTLGGRVEGFDKYLLPPVGQCDASRLSSGVREGTSLCEPCQSDAACSGESARCTRLGEQGERCTIGCEVDADCPTGFVCTGVGFGAVQCVPSPGERVAWCATTIPGVFHASSRPGCDPDAVDLTGTDDAPCDFTDEANRYRITSSPGEKAIVCMGGYKPPNGGDFVPLRMGVRQHVFAEPGQDLDDVDVELDIPMSRTMRMRLDDPPTGPERARNYQLDVFLDLGSDGVFPFPRTRRGTGAEEALFELEHFPVAFEESLEGASYTILARARPDTTLAGSSSERSVTIHRDVTAPNEDAIFEVRPDGVEVRSTGLTHDVHAMDAAGSGQLWAVGDEGRILSWAGSWWARQTSPTEANLRAVWAAAGDEVWAAGDQGTVVRWNGVVWKEVPVPDELAGVRWRALGGSGETLWLVGDEGVWLHRGNDWTPVDVGGSPEDGTLRDIWVAGPGEAWLVGDGGTVRRVGPNGVESIDPGGPDLMAVTGTERGEVWAVGRDGRIGRWTGRSWFDYLPRTNDDLHAVFASGSDALWAAGNAGSLLRWDGDRWTVRAEAPRVDLRALHGTAGTLLAGGLHTLVVGPVLRLPEPVNPDASGRLDGSVLEWAIPGGPAASFTRLRLAGPQGLPLWQLMVDGGRRTVPLPDLRAAWGIQPLPPGDGSIRMTRVYDPEFDVDRYDLGQLVRSNWRAWAIAELDAEWPGSR